MKEGNLEVEDINSVYCCANGNSQQDAIEANQLLDLFSWKKTDFTSVKHYVGESFGASGSLTMAAALCDLSVKTKPSMFNPNDPSSDNYWIPPNQESGSSRPNHCLIAGLGYGGNNASILLKAF